MFFRRIRRRRSLFQISPILQVISQLQPMEVLTMKYVTKRQKKSGKLLPWWCLFIAYSLSFAMITLCILFIIARAIEFGDVNVRKWLVSIIIGFLSSVLFTQPIKVCIVTNSIFKDFIISIWIGTECDYPYCVDKSSNKQK